MHCESAGRNKNGRLKWRPRRLRRQENVQGDLLRLRGGMRSSVRTVGRKAGVLQELLPKPQETPKRRWWRRTRQILKANPPSFSGVEKRPLFSFFLVSIRPKRSLYFSRPKRIYDIQDGAQTARGGKGLFRNGRKQGKLHFRAMAEGKRQALEKGGWKKVGDIQNQRGKSVGRVHAPCPERKAENPRDAGEKLA